MSDRETFLMMRAALISKKVGGQVWYNAFWFFSARQTL